MKTTLSRRAMMAGIPAVAMMPAATQANGAHAHHFATTDPVFAAIEKHRQPVQGDTREADKISNQLLAVEGDAWLAWLTTPILRRKVTIPPATLAGIAAALEHASHRPYPHNPDYPYDYIHTNLIKTAQYLPGDLLEAGERFFQR